ncbi:uncharacterized protein [Mytilus edulis]|uniref:uncharacterized protein n=1 Tax=Mytilus edulis TaxID=6550 RepID=UPI0039EEF89F
MTVRLLAIPLKFHFLVTCIAITTPLKEDLSPKIIMLNATRLEYNESGTIELNCSSSRKSIGNGAEFIVNGLTVEHISFRDNKCYNRKMEECITDHCQCFPIDKLYIYEHKDKLLATEVIVSCRMRFVDNKTSNIIKAVISLRFNGTVSVLHKYDVKMLKQDTDKNTDENKNNSSIDQISRWVPAMCGVLLVISAVSILCVCRVRRQRRRRRKHYFVSFVIH